MPEVPIDAEPRTEFGKGPARRIRRDGRVPAVLYGHRTDPKHLTLPGHEVLLALRTPNVLIRLEGLSGGAQLALPKAVQRDPIKGYVEHVDLLTVRRGEKVTVDIPVTVVGEVAPDGLLDQQLVQISVEAEATNIPHGHRGQTSRAWRSARPCTPATSSCRLASPSRTTPSCWCCTSWPRRPPSRWRPSLARRRGRGGSGRSGRGRARGCAEAAGQLARVGLSCATARGTRRPR